MAAVKPNPGRTTLHRLNRTEYGNAIRDLLALEIDVADVLPADDIGYGFDNIGDVLSVSPFLLERYLVTAGKISRAAVGDTTMPVQYQTYGVNRGLKQSDRMSDMTPVGSRGGTAIRHRFPVADLAHVLVHVLSRAHVGVAAQHPGQHLVTVEVRDGHVHTPG